MAKPRPPLIRIKTYCKRHNIPYYTESELQHLFEIYKTYKYRDGYLTWEAFAYIPIKGDPGDLSKERLGSWCRYIREHLAKNGKVML